MEGEARLKEEEETMKKGSLLFSKTILVTTLVMLLFTSGCNNEEAGKEADIAAVKEVLNQYAVGINSGDLDLWLSLWAEDGTRMPPNAATQLGREQIAEGVGRAFGAMNMAMTVDIEEARVSGDLGLTRAAYSFRMTPKAGGEEIIVEPDGKALTLYERQPDGSWKIIFDCFNSNVPPGQE